MRRLLVLALAASLLVPVGAFAQGKGKGKGHDKGHGDGKGKEATHVAVVKGKDEHVVVVFNDTQRGAARTYFVNTYGRGNCPPGLAKKNNGCLPPGQAKKRYVVGQRLPNGVVVTEVPAVLVTRLGPAPAGYRYGIIDGDLVKLSVGTMLVVDAIQGFVR